MREYLLHMFALLADRGGLPIVCLYLDFETTRGIMQLRALRVCRRRRQLTVAGRRCKDSSCLRQPYFPDLNSYIGPFPPMNNLLLAGTFPSRRRGLRPLGAIGQSLQGPELQIWGA